MATIEVNHKVLRDVASAVSTYCDEQNREMQAADEEIKSLLSSGWLGADAQQFGSKWEGVDDNDSTAVKFRDSLKSFGETLTSCANGYQKAQEDTYNAALGLFRPFFW